MSDIGITSAKEVIDSVITNVALVADVVAQFNEAVNVKANWQSTVDGYYELRTNNYPLLMKYVTFQPSLKTDWQALAVHLAVMEKIKTAGYIVRYIGECEHPETEALHNKANILIRLRIADKRSY